jgi:hypothetical protein
VDDVLDYTLNGETQPQSPAKVDPYVAELKAEIEALKNGLTNEKKTKEQQDYDASLRVQHETIQKFIGENAEKYSYTNALGKEAIDMVWKNIESHYAENEEILPYDKAIEIVERNAREFIKQFVSVPSFAQDFGLSPREIKAVIEQSRSAVEESPFDWNQGPSSMFSESVTDGSVRESYEHLSDDELLRKAAAMVKYI